MTSATILIVEDEPLIADDIAMILERNGYQIQEIVDNAEDTLAELKSTKPDLILLDVNIEGDKDGIQLAHQINQDFQLPFVFLTSYYDNNTLKRAKATNPNGYVVKPFDEGDLIANIELALMKSKAVKSAVPIDKFFVRNHQELKAIEPAEILYAESDDNYANIYTAEEKHVVSHTLKSVEDKLEANGFVRIHKSYLINFRKITSIHEGYAFIEEIKLPIGRSYKDDLIKNLSIL
ncbi:MAG: LytR/AlgR family response regulator transcription factor [Ekhidna sp.]